MFLFYLDIVILTFIMHNKPLIKKSETLRKETNIILMI